MHQLYLLHNSIHSGNMSPAASYQEVLHVVEGLGHRGVLQLEIGFLCTLFGQTALEVTYLRIFT